MRPWYRPPAKGEGAGGPLSVKCHSKRFVSSGEAVKSAEGWACSSEASLTWGCQYLMWENFK